MRKSLSLAFIGLLACLSVALAVDMTYYSSAAYEASAVIKTVQGRVYMITGYNSSASDQFIQLHNTTSLPADTAVPKVIIKANAGKNFSFEIPADGIDFTTGIVICNSSTGPTKTIGSADCWFQLHYR